MHGAWSQRAVGDEHAAAVLGGWLTSARYDQYPLWRLMPGAPDRWLVMGGRGAGKTRLGAEWVNGIVHGLSPFSLTRYGAIALVGETLADVREVMVEGPSGIRRVARRNPPRLEASRRRLVWDETGAVAHFFSSEDPESLRGPQFDAAWCDELAKWRHLDETYDMLQFGLRLGQRPQQLITTTPRARPLLRALAADPGVHLTRMRTSDNAGHLAASFIAAVTARYGGTRLGRQELDGELIEDRPDALWTRAALEQALAARPEELRRIVVAVDPPASSGKASDACGIVAAGLGANGRAFVLADATVERAKPTQWAARAIALYRSLEADCILVETNQGGEMATTVVHSVDAGVPVRTVRARRGKWLRAEPVAALYEQGRVAHAARFPALEDEMCDFGPDGLSGGRSPDRVDALVWALTELMLGRRDDPRIREL